MTRAQPCFLQGEFALLQQLLEVSQESLGVSAVNDSLIEAQCEIDQRSNSDGVFTFGCGDYAGAFFSLAYPQNCDLWLVDDWGAEQPPKNTRVGDRKRAARDFIRLQLFCSGSFSQIVGGPRQAGDRQIVRP